MIVAQRIVEDIDRRGLRAGNRLPAEQAMLEEYQVGRAALREALRVLEDRGLVELRQGRTGGPVVLEVGAGEVAAHLELTMRRLDVPDAAVLEAWSALSTVVAQLSARRLTGAEVGDLEARYAEIVGTGDGVLGRADLLDSILDAAGNPMVDVLFRCLLEALDRVAVSDPVAPPDAESDPPEHADRVVAVLVGLTCPRRR
jgi:DNA-binding FadR family transcriptional regulator